MQKLWLRVRRKGHSLSPALLAIARALGNIQKKSSKIKQKYLSLTLVTQKI